MEVYLNRHGEIFCSEGDILHRVEAAGKLKQLCQNPYDSFFKQSFHKVACCVESGESPKVVKTFYMTAGDFNPSSLFDACYAVRQYISHQKLYLPRLYLYPTSVCNSRCRLCQFHERHDTGEHLRQSEMKKALDTFYSYKGEIKSQSVIISGDGEPLVYPHIKALLEQAAVYGFRVFLTTNLIKPYIGNGAVYELMTTSKMITVSIKGLSADAYAYNQGLSDRSIFDRVLKNLRTLRDMAKDSLIGVASLILPENTGHYRRAIDLFAGMGLDYFYLNQVEPSPQKWGIKFTEEQKVSTSAEFTAYANSPYKNMIVRFPLNPFETRYQDTAYYDAAKLRENKDICGSALFNPLVMGQDGKAKWIACRSSEMFENNAFHYKTDINGIEDFSAQSVMSATQKCHSCRLERQVKHFDKIISVEREYNGKLEYYLVFDTEKLADGASVINFDCVAR